MDSTQSTLVWHRSNSNFFAKFRAAGDVQFRTAEIWFGEEIEKSANLEIYRDLQRTHTASNMLIN